MTRELTWAAADQQVVVRLVNVSPTELKVALRPPVRRELDVQLCGRLTITSGASTEMRVHFRPRDVRPLRDELRVRVSLGQNIHVPINCYMEPPILDGQYRLTAV